MNAKISKGNKKIGKIWNISLTPVISCPTGVPCAKDCYAMKAYRQYKNVRTAWDHNYRLYLTDAKQYFTSIQDQLQEYKGKTFRWHVAGDIVDTNYLLGMIETAELFPEIRFLAFTKNTGVLASFYDPDMIPGNLQIIVSAWPKRDLPVWCTNYSIAWLSEDIRVKQGRFRGRLKVRCNDSCETCKKSCWTAGNKVDVIFEKH